MNTKSFFVKPTLLMLSAGLLLSFSSCAKKMTFNNAGVAPAAQGYVKVKTDKNKNYIMDIDVVHLAPSSNLRPPKKTYVVWLITENNGTKNIGQLNSSTGMISNTLKGSLHATSAFKPSGFFITAEDAAEITYPGSLVILKTN